MSHDHDSTGAMASAWFGTPAARAVNAVFGHGVEIGDTSTPQGRLVTLIAESLGTGHPAMADLAALLLAASSTHVERLKLVAALAHDGGLANLSESATLTAIRRLTIGDWDGRGTIDERCERVRKAAEAREPRAMYGCGGDPLDDDRADGRA